jgi:hypothetical protein
LARTQLSNGQIPRKFPHRKAIRQLKPIAIRGILILTMLLALFLGPQNRIGARGQLQMTSFEPAADSDSESPGPIDQDHAGHWNPA